MLKLAVWAALCVTKLLAECTPTGVHFSSLNLGVWAALTQFHLAVPPGDARTGAGGAVPGGQAGLIRLMNSRQNLS